MKTWLITGTSKGFGRVWAKAALDRGDQVVATARHLDSLQGLERPLRSRRPDPGIGCHRQTCGG